jgi:hypothetical protein
MLIHLKQSQDSWKGSPGSSQGTPQVRLMPRGLRLKCCRSRLACGGCFSCSQVDTELLNIEGWELNPLTCDKIFAVQRKTCWEEGNTADKRPVMYVDLFCLDSVANNLALGSS